LVQNWNLFAKPNNDRLEKLPMELMKSPELPQSSIRRVKERTNQKKFSICPEYFSNFSNIKITVTKTVSQ